ncbi:MAG: hypothetical protein C5B46_01195, partial [Proteobacteria bacterium]
AQDPSAPPSRAVMIDEDYFAAGASPELDRRVDGDAFLAGGRVAMRGPVKGDAVLTGGDIIVTDTVAQDLYAAGGSLALSGQVVGNARIAGGQVVVSPHGGIGGKATIAAGTFRLAGRVGHYLVVYADSVRIDGEVGGDLRVVAHSVVIGPEAHVRGRLIYRSFGPARIDPTAVIAGGVTREGGNRPEIGPEHPFPAAELLSVLLVAASLLVVGGALIVVFPAFSTRAAQTIRSNPWKSVSLGFALLLCLPAAAGLFMFTVVGIPLGLLLLFLYPIMLLLGYLNGLLFLADRFAAWIARRRGFMVKTRGRIGALTLVIVGTLLAIKIPYAGTVLMFVVLLAGLGAFWLRAYRGYVELSAAQPQHAGLDVV